MYRHLIVSESETGNGSIDGTLSPRRDIGRNQSIINFHIPLTLCKERLLYLFSRRSFFIDRESIFEKR